MNLLIVPPSVRPRVASTYLPLEYPVFSSSVFSFLSSSSTLSAYSFWAMSTLSPSKL